MEDIHGLCGVKAFISLLRFYLNKKPSI